MLLFLLSILSGPLIDQLNLKLPDHYPEVYELKNPLPFDGHGWFGHEEHFKNLLAEKKPKIAIEVGSWLGCSARSIASKLPSDGILIAVDHWKGSIEHQDGQWAYYEKLPVLYEQFLSNVIEAKLTDKIIPFRSDSLSAALHLKNLGIKADFIYLDGAHDYYSVLNDLVAYYPLLADDGILVGDDFAWQSVEKAVRDFASYANLEVESYSTSMYQLKKRKTH